MSGSVTSRLRTLSLRWLEGAAPGALAAPPMLSRLMLATISLTVVIGLLVDKFGGVAGQLAVSVWTWALFAVLLTRINQPLRLPLMLCLVIATFGECCLSLLWGLYVYWMHNIPLFVPPGHVLLFALGLNFAPRLPRWAIVLVAAFAAGYGAIAYLTSTDTLSVALAILFLVFMAFGSNRRLYATMFIISLLMELYGTWIGNWVWLQEVPGLPLSSANPPLCVGGLYCALDLCVVNADRYLRRRQRPGEASVIEAGSAA
jgi:hypothetical protein